MSFIALDHPLENLKCSKCRKYLSLKPVKVYQNRKVLCGRCSTKNDGGTVSMYEHLIDSLLFPCINRYEGCSMLLRAHEVQNHEKVCTGGRYSCPICSLFIGTAYELLVHFQDDHIHQVLKQQIFTVVVTGEIEKYFLYCKDSLIFIIEVKSSVNEEYFKINSYVVAPEIIAENIKQKFFLTLINEKYSFTTDSKPVSSILNRMQGYNIRNITTHCSINSSPTVICTFEIDAIKTFNFMIIDGNNNTKNGINDKSLQNLQNHKNNTITASPDEDFNKRTIFLSDQFKFLYPSHSISTDKKTLLYEGKKLEIPCVICNYFYSEYESHFGIVCEDCCIPGDTGRSIFLLKEFKCFLSLLYECKYECGRTYSGKDIKAHEIKCTKRVPLNCPVKKCLWNGPFCTLEEHFTQNHRDYSLHLSRFFGAFYYRQNDLFVLVRDKFYIVYFTDLADSKMGFITTIDDKKCNLDIKYINTEGNLVCMSMSNFVFDTSKYIWFIRETKN